MDKKMIQCTILCDNAGPYTFTLDEDSLAQILDIYIPEVSLASIRMKKNKVINFKDNLSGYEEMKNAVEERMNSNNQPQPQPVPQPAPEAPNPDSDLTRNLSDEQPNGWTRENGDDLKKIADAQEKQADALLSAKEKLFKKLRKIAESFQGYEEYINEIISFLESDRDLSILQGRADLDLMAINRVLTREQYDFNEKIEKINKDIGRIYQRRIKELEKLEDEKTDLESRGSNVSEEEKERLKELPKLIKDAQKLRKEAERLVTVLSSIFDEYKNDSEKEEKDKSSQQNNGDEEVRKNPKQYQPKRLGLESLPPPEMKIGMFGGVTLRGDRTKVHRRLSKEYKRELYTGKRKGEKPPSILSEESNIIQAYIEYAKQCGVSLTPEEIRNVRENPGVYIKDWTTRYANSDTYHNRFTKESDSQDHGGMIAIKEEPGILHGLYNFITNTIHVRGPQGKRLMVENAAVAAGLFGKQRPVSYGYSDRTMVAKGQRSLFLSRLNARNINKSNSYHMPAEKRSESLRSVTRQKTKETKEPEEPEV